MASSACAAKISSVSSVARSGRRLSRGASTLNRPSGCPCGSSSRTMQEIFRVPGIRGLWPVRGGQGTNGMHIRRDDRGLVGRDEIGMSDLKFGRSNCWMPWQWLFVREQFLQRFRRHAHACHALEQSALRFIDAQQRDLEGGGLLYGGGNGIQGFFKRAVQVRGRGDLCQLCQRRTRGFSIARRLVIVPGSRRAFSNAIAACNARVWRVSEADWSKKWGVCACRLMTPRFLPWWMIGTTSAERTSACGGFSRSDSKSETINRFLRDQDLPRQVGKRFLDRATQPVRHFRFGVIARGSLKKQDGAAVSPGHLQALSMDDFQQMGDVHG